MQIAFLFKFAVSSSCRKICDNYTPKSCAIHAASYTTQAVFTNPYTPINLRQCVQDGTISPLTTANKQYVAQHTPKRMGHLLC